MKNILMFPLVNLPTTIRENENYDLPRAFARECIVRRRTQSLRKVSAVGQNQPEMVEIKGFKTSYFDRRAQESM
jgi:hypothetical protein